MGVQLDELAEKNTTIEHLPTARITGLSQAVDVAVQPLILISGDSDSVVIDYRSKNNTDNNVANLPTRLNRTMRQQTDGARIVSAIHLTPLRA